MKFLIFAAAFAASGFADAAGPTIPGIGAKTYRLDSKRSDKRFCGATVEPRVRRGDRGRLVLSLNAELGFEWVNTRNLPGEDYGDCFYGTEQSVSSRAGVSTLTTVNVETCKDGKSQAGSERNALVLRGDEIEYTVDSVVKDRAGNWAVDPKKESYRCIWTVSR